MKIELKTPYRRVGMKEAIMPGEYNAKDPRVKRFVDYWLSSGFAVVTEPDPPADVPKAKKPLEAEKEAGASDAPKASAPSQRKSSK